MQIENHKEEVPFGHYEALLGKADPAEITARLPYVRFDGREFFLTLLGREYAVSFPGAVVRPVDGGKVPTEADKQINSPYNTYMYKGLPAGPISNPGMDSIEAAMNPENTNYFYYALGDDGVHHFNTNYNAHLNFINSQKLYQK